MAGELFGPYLGWEPVRLAAAALNRLYPIAYTAERLDPSRRELARSRGIGSRDRRRLAARIRAVLRREPAAVAAAQARLVELRDLAAGDLQFETAAEVQRQVQALRWIAQARLRVAGGGPDMDVWALAGPQLGHCWRPSGRCRTQATSSGPDDVAAVRQTGGRRTGRSHRPRLSQQ